MIDSAKRRGSSRSELAFSQLLAVFSLAACITWVYHDLQFVIGSSVISPAEFWDQARNTILPWRVAGFVAAVLAVHLALGVLAWGLARMTYAALGLSRSRPAYACIALWFVLIGLLVLVANSVWYPASVFASGASWLRSTWFGVPAIALLLAATSIAILMLAMLAAMRQEPRSKFRQRLILPILAVAAVLSTLPLMDLTLSQAASSTTKPNVVIIGIDSLRSDLSEVVDSRQITPNLDAFMSGAHRFSDALSPLARTYPAWVSILTGRHPVTTNARFNLMPREMVREGDTLADSLRLLGYRTVFASDEVRFANIDESFGFDQVVSPPMGASDFLLGTIGDLPLVNLIASSQVGDWIFPSNHANRAAHVTYQPVDFISRLDRQINPVGPTFLAVNLTLAHWPYSWADQAKPTTPQAWRPAYRDAIAAVDGQFQELIVLLERKGLLDNAIVVVLSDHGDALGYPSDSMLRKTGTSREIWDSLWGHGTSVMSPHQYSVPLGLRAFGSAHIPGDLVVHDWPVGLEDVRPTLEELVTGEAPRSVDGLSLVPYLAVPARAAGLAGRIRFTETCFNTVKLMQGDYRAADVAQEAAVYFEIDTRSGWVQLRRDRLDEIMSTKQRAALSSDAILAAIPSWTDDSVTYLYSSRRRPLPREVTAPPDPRTEPEAARLWNALERRFPGELSPPAKLP